MARKMSQHLNTKNHFIQCHMKEIETLKVSFPRTQCNVPGQAWTQTARSRVKSFNHEAIAHPHYPMGSMVTIKALLPLCTPLEVSAFVKLSCSVTPPPPTLIFLPIYTLPYLRKKDPWVYIAQFNFNCSLLCTVHVFFVMTIIRLSLILMQIIERQMLPHFLRH